MRIALPPAIDAHAFAGLNRHLPILYLDGETMGTIWRVLYAHPSADPVAVRAMIERRLAGIVDQMSHWAADSLLTRFNHAPAGSWITLPHDFASVIDAALTLADISGGAFDPAIGRLVDAWGFGPPGPVAGPPDAATVRGLRGKGGWRRLAWDAPLARLRQPGGVSLDLSGIAKGHAVDAVATALADAGVAHLLVEIGGELAGRGVRPDGEPWWVDLENPPGVTLPPLRIALHGIAVATSGNYRRGDHSIDPRTGMPATGDVVSASVIAPLARDADGWATALTVLGADAGMVLAAEHGIAARLVTMDGEGRCDERLTPALLAMLDD